MSKIKFKIIQINENLALRPFNLEMVNDTYLSWMRDPAINRFLESRFSNFNIQSLLYYVNTILSSDNNFFFGIFFDDIHIGNIKLGPIDFNHLTADLGFLIGDKNFHGMGICFNSIMSILEFSKELGLKKITAGSYAQNQASINVLKKCGFICEGIRIKQVIFKEKRIDTLIFGIIL